VLVDFPVLIATGFCLILVLECDFECFGLLLFPIFCYFWPVLFRQWVDFDCGVFLFGLLLIMYELRHVDFFAPISVWEFIFLLIFVDFGY
jgi:hypothetical protein